MTIPNVNYALDCENGGNLPCADDGGQMSYMGDGTIATTCTDGTNPVTFTTGHAVGTAPNDITFTPSAPVVVAANNTCLIDFDVEILAHSDDLTPNFVEVAQGWSGQCNNGLTANAGATAAFRTVSPDIDIEKEVSLDNVNFFDADVPPGPIGVLGADAWYRLTVTNTGNETLTNVVINDPTLGLVNVPLPAACLPFEANDVCVLTSGEIAELFFANRCDSSGVKLNTATADGEGAGSGAPVSDNDPANLTCVNPDIDIEKEVSLDNVNFFDADAPPGPIGTLGADAWYRLTVTNTGDETLTNVVINDPTLGLVNVPLPAACLPFEANDVCVLTSGEIAELFFDNRCDSSGVKLNTATADGEGAGSGAPVSDNDPANLTCVNPDIAILKEVSVDGGAFFDANDPPFPIGLAGSSAEYRLTVTNIGTETLVNVVLNDATLGLVNVPLPAACEPFEPGDICVITSATVDFGALAVADICPTPGDKTNTAMASGAGAGSGAPVSDNDPATVSCVMPDIAILKEVSVDGGAFFDANDPPFPIGLPGSSAEYRLTVTNTGTETLVNVVLNDATLGLVNVALPAACEPFEPGDVCVITSATVDFGALAVGNICPTPGDKTNTAMASGAGAGSGAPVNDSDPATVDCRDPDIEILKEVSVDGGPFEDANTAPFPTGAAGSTAEYRLTVTNTGTETLVNVVLNDATLGLVNVPLPAACEPFEPGDVCVITSATVDFSALSEDDICPTPGNKTNTATVDGEGEGSGAPVSDNDPATVSCEQVGICLVVIDEEGVDNDFRNIERAADVIGLLTPGELINDESNVFNDDVPTEVGNPPFPWNILVDMGEVPSGIPPVGGDLVLLPTGQVDDEGWFNLPPGPDILYKDNSRPPNCGLPGGYDEWIDRFIAGTLSQHCLDEVLDVMPLRNQDLAQMVGRECVAVVYDSDISINYEPLFGNLQGARYGTFHFFIEALELPGSIPESKSDTSLYDLWLLVLGVFEGDADPLDFVTIHDHEPDSIEINRARCRNGDLTIRGESDFRDSFMTTSVDGPDDGSDPFIDPLLLEVPMLNIGRGRFQLEVNGVDCSNFSRQRVSIQTDEGGAYNDIIR